MPFPDKTQKHPAKRVMTQFWGTHQRFFRQLCMAMKLPRLVEIVKTAITEDKCVVIGLQTTGESRLQEAVRCAPPCARTPCND